MMKCGTISSFIHMLFMYNGGIFLRSQMKTASSWVSIIPRAVLDREWGERFA